MKKVKMSSDSEVDSNEMEELEEEDSNIASDPEANTDDSSDDGEEEQNQDDDDDDDEDEEEEGDEDDDDEDGEEKEEKMKNKIPFDTAKDDIEARLAKHRGKSLYVRFAKKPPTDTEILEKNMKTLCDRIIKVRRPRQWSTTFCLVDFETEEDRDEGMKVLKDVEIDGRKLVVQTPITEGEDFAEKVLQRRKEMQEKKLEWMKLKHASKVQPFQQQQKTFTASLFVRNIPLDCSQSDLKAHFPNALDVKLNANKGDKDYLTAVITLPSPKDATQARNTPTKIGENILNILFAKDFSARRAETNFKGRFPQNRFFNKGQRPNFQRPNFQRPNLPFKKRNDSVGETDEKSPKPLKKEKLQSTVGTEKSPKFFKKGKLQNPVESVVEEQIPEKQAGKVKKNKQQQNGNNENLDTDKKKKKQKPQQVENFTEKTNKPQLNDENRKRRSSEGESDFKKLNKKQKLGKKQNKTAVQENKVLHNGKVKLGKKQKTKS